MGAIKKLAKTAIRAYHGSPHDFDRFDVSKIGNGEGNQIFGHGLYFAGNEDVAKWYREALAPAYELDGRDYGFARGLNPAEKKGVQLLQGLGTREAVMERLANEPETAAAFDALFTSGRLRKGGRTYEVDIHADPEMMLDWDTLLKDQGPVNEIISPLIADRVQRTRETREKLLRDGGRQDLVRKQWKPLTDKQRAEYSVPYEPTGQQAYDIMQVDRGAISPGQKAPEVSADLYERGIPGVRYLDAFSRNGGGESSNYVTFGDDMVEIKRKYQRGGYVDDGYEDEPQAYAGGGLARKLVGKLTQAQRHVPGKPDTVRIPGYGEVEAAPIREVEQSAERYMDSVGRPGAHRLEQYEDFDEDRARRIAEAFEAMKHDPTNPETKRSYDAMIDETLAQYKSLKDAGVDIKFLKDGQADPYAKSPALGYVDMVENGRLWVFPTDQGFGTLNAVEDNPLLKRVGRVGDLENATANDAFRAVHDIYGHFGPGNPFFRHKGEERAWDNHSRMYSKDALPAMTTETRGQNSWLNFGPFAEHNRTALGADTVFADQKIGLLPPWAYEGRAHGGFVQQYATGGLVGGMAASDYEDSPAEPAMFLGRKARNAPLQFLDYVEKKINNLHQKEPSPDTRKMEERWMWQDDLAGKNRDGKMMYEIDDSMSALKELPQIGPLRNEYEDVFKYLEAKKAWTEAGGKTLPPQVVGDVIDHPELFEAYPELKGTRLRWDNAMDAYGSMQSDISGNPQVLTLRQLGRSADEIHKTLLHELQHGVQAREGWTRGSNHDIGRMLVGKQDRIEQYIMDLMSAQDLLEAGKANDPAVVAKVLGHLPENEIKQVFKDAMTRSPDQVEELYGQNRKARQAFSDVHGAYERNAGEIEARNVSNRHYLDYDSRRRQFWKDTEDRQGEPRILETPNGPVLSWD